VIPEMLEDPQVLIAALLDEFQPIPAGAAETDLA